MDMDINLTTNGKEVGVREIMPQNNNGDLDFTGLKEVDENSIEAKLYNLIDDISTAGDMFKPEIDGHFKYIQRKIEEASRYIVSDGYKLFYVTPNLTPEVNRRRNERIEEAEENINT